jgi:hypothetical protein
VIKNKNVDGRLSEFFNGRDHFNSILFVDPIIIAQRNWNLNVWSRPFVDASGPVLTPFFYDGISILIKKYSNLNMIHIHRPPTHAFYQPTVELFFFEFSRVWDADDYRGENVVVSRSFLSTVRRVIKLASRNANAQHSQKH